jgi:hypothetical protein
MKFDRKSPVRYNRNRTREIKQKRIKAAKRKETILAVLAILSRAGV